MLENISIIVALCLSVASFVVAVLSFRLKVPKLKIQILNKRYDCFFGNVQCGHNEKIRKKRVSGVRLRLINSSPNEITIMGAFLSYQKEIHRLIDCTNKYWEIVEFIYPDDEGNETFDGSAIYYGNEGMTLPLNLKAYEGKDVVALFYHFPVNIKNQARAKITIQSSVGTKSKRVKLLEYNDRHMDEDYRDYEQYLRSINADTDT